jgi:hypothetical protein
MSVPWLRRLDTSLSSRKFGLNPRPVHVGFVVDKVAMEEACSEYLGLKSGSFEEGAVSTAFLKAS